MSNHETSESEYLGDMYAKHGGNLGWSIFAGGQQPDEMAEMLEEGRLEIDQERGEILNAVLEVALEGFRSMPTVERVGGRMIGLAAALAYPGVIALPLPGVAKRFAEFGDRRMITGILAFFLHGANVLSARSVGKQILAVAEFLNRDELAGYSMSEAARVAGETPAGMMERVKRMCSVPIRRQGGRGRATWQQGDGQKAKSAAAQKQSHAKRKRAANKTAKPKTEIPS